MERKKIARIFKWGETLPGGRVPHAVKQQVNWREFATSGSASCFTIIEAMREEAKLKKKEERRMNKSIAIAAMLTCAAPSTDACQSDQRNYFSFGPGLVTCREFIRSMKRDGTQITELFFASWALGFASGLSHGGEIEKPEAILPYRDILIKLTMKACETRGDWYFGTALEAVIDQITPVRARE